MIESHLWFHTFRGVTQVDVGCLALLTHLAENDHDALVDLLDSLRIFSLQKKTKIFSMGN
jgi:hypothetical protein